jgi:hypothetical protein
MPKFLLFLILLIFPFFVWADNSGNSTGYAWFEKIGWVHFSGEDAGVDYGIKISSDQITGYAWSEKTGWISLSCLNSLSCNGQPYGVVSDGEGNLSGYAWSEKGGWINFNGVGTVEYQVQIDSNGNLSGYAWSEKVGWINTDDIGENYGVTTVAGEGYCEDCVPCNPPVLAWNLDEGFGMTAYDSSFRGNNIYNNGTVAGGAVWQSQSECVSGKCLYFDGSNDNINRAYDSDLSFKSNSFSIGGWFKTSTVANPAYLFSRYDTAGWKVWLDADGDACFGIDDDNVWSGETPDDFVCTVGKNYDDNNWHYVLAKKDATGGIYLYLDGQEEVSDLTLTATGPLSGTSPIFYAGVNSDGTTSLFGGFLDAIKIYDYARSVDQIKQDYNEGLSGISSNRGIGVSAGDNSPKWMSDGLVGYWKMDEASWNGTANEVIDASGNNNHGKAFSGSVPTGGKFGNGGEFAGLNDSIIVNDNDSLDFYKKFSISFWANQDAFVGGGLVSKYSSGGLRSYSIRPANEDELGFALSSDGDNYSSYYTTNNCGFVSNGQWYHFNVIFNEGSLKVYRDANLCQEFTTNIPFLNNSSVNLEIGKFNFSAPSFDGKIDEVRAYNRALSPDEIKQLYNYAPGPVLHLKMDEKSGTTAFDSSGNDNHGTLLYDTKWNNGEINSALDFDGVGDVVTFSDGPQWNSKTFSVSAWVNFKSETGPSYNMPVSASSNLDNKYYFDFKNNAISFKVNDNNAPAWITATYSIDPRNKWYFVSGAFDGSFVYLYVDGVLRQKTSFTGNYPASNGAPDIGNFGSSNNNVYAFNGIVDDVRIYNYARTQEQILEDMGASAGASASRGALQKPILDLNFDEGQGTTAFDSSGNNNHGTLISGTTGGNTTTTAMWDKGGKIGGAMEFDGTDDYILISDNADINPNNQWTVVAWVKLDNISGGRKIVSRGSSGESIDTNANTGLSVDDGNVKVDYEYGTGGTNVTRYSASTLDTGVWYFISGVYTGGDIEVYVNGALDNGLITGTPSNLPNTTSSVLTVGAFGGGVIDKFDGKIDEVKIYNYALSEDEIKTLYNGSAAMAMGSDESRNNNGTEVTGANKDYCIPGDSVKCDKPVLELKMDEMSGSTVNDTSGNGRNGTINGATWEPSGKIGSALKFDGVDDYVDGTIITASDWTLNIWVKANNLSGIKNILMNGDDYGSSKQGMSIILNGGKPKLNIVVGTDVVESIESPDNIATDKWINIVGTKNGSEVNLYIDGIKKQSGTLSSSIDYSSSISELFVGVDASLGSLFSGFADEIKIYDYARTPAQIAWDYNRGKPIGHWKMDEASGTQVDDWSGNANHGTMTNMDPIGDRVAGKNNKALDFDGIDDYVGIGTAINNINAVSFWIKPTSTSQSILDLDGGTHNISISGGAVTATGFNTYYVDGQLNGTISDTNWHHITAISNTAFNSTTAFTIGKINTNYYSGNIDDVKIYNYIPTDEQIKLDYNNGAVNFR